MKRVPFFLFTLLLALACGQNIEPVEQYGDIAGVVYDKKVGDPIPVAQVQLSPGGKSTVTGTDGAFSFTNIEPGRYTVNVTKQGYNDGSNTVTVTAGAKSDCNLLMERIPAYVTADKTELDFGDNQTHNTLSFNIVNSSYETLSWHIEYDKSSTSFIDGITPESGNTQYGKTATIVVKINRDKLNAGVNETTLVIVSDNGDGSSEVKIKATGQEKKLAALNVQDVTDITAYTAILNAEITDFGEPALTERGFLIGDNENLVLETADRKVTAAVTDNASFSVKVDNLRLGHSYYVRGYAINSIGTAYSNNQVKFTTLAQLAVVSVADASDIRSDSAILHGTLDNVGVPECTEKGFVISESENPTTDTAFKKIAVDGLSTGEYSARVEGLGLGKTYYVRSYAVNAVGTAYSSSQAKFTTLSQLAVVYVADVSDIKSNSAILHGTLDNVGVPECTEKGFVISESENPTTDTALKKIAVDGLSTGEFSARVEGLGLGKTYYVRSYAVNAVGTAYSSSQAKFTTVAVLPEINTLAPTGEDRESKSAVLHGSIVSEGDPAYSERGFVYSTEYENPTTEDNKVVVSGSGVGDYEKRITFDDVSSVIYVRAYAINAKGTAYGEVFSIFQPEWITLKSLNLGVQREDIGQGTWSDMESLCDNSSVGGLTDWRLPTKNELSSLYTLKEEIGNFDTRAAYWSSSARTEPYETWDSSRGRYVRKIRYYYFYCSFNSGSWNESEGGEYSSVKARCVRTLE